MASVSISAEELRRRFGGPQPVPASSAWDMAKRTWAAFTEDRILLVAGGVTFYVLLAMVPALASFISLYGLFFDPQDINRQIGQLSGLVPQEALGIVQDQATRIAAGGRSTLSFAFATALVLSLWSANSGIKAIMEALNIANEEREQRSFVWLNLHSLMLTLGAIAFLIAMMAALAVLPVVLRATGLEGAGRVLLAYGRWPVLLVVVVAALAVLYRYGPSQRRPEWRWLTWGSILAAFGWLVFSMLFSWYVGHFASYNRTYGSLGAVIAFMTWLWLSITIVLAGAELDAQIERRLGHEPAAPDRAAKRERGATGNTSLTMTWISALNSPPAIRGECRVRCAACPACPRTRSGRAP